MAAWVCGRSKGCLPAGSCAVEATPVKTRKRRNRAREVGTDRLLCSWFIVKGKGASSLKGKHTSEALNSAESFSIIDPSLLPKGKDWQRGRDRHALKQPDERTNFSAIEVHLQNLPGRPAIRPSFLTLYTSSAPRSPQTPSLPRPFPARRGEKQFPSSDERRHLQDWVNSHGWSADSRVRQSPLLLAVRWHCLLRSRS